MKRSILFILITLFTYSTGISAQDEYRIEIGTSTGGTIQLYHENGTAITDAEIEEGFASVIKGEVVTVVVSPASGHDFSSLNVQGGTNIQYDATDKNKATFTVAGTGKVIVTPLFNGSGTKVSFSTDGTQNGTFIVRYNGRNISSGTSVPYGSEIEIVGQPTDASYAVSEVKVNGQIAGAPVNNTVTYTVSAEVTTITVSFTGKTVKVMHLKPGSGSETPILKKGTKDNFDTAEEIALGAIIPYNTQITIQPKNYSYDNIYTLIINGYRCELDIDGFYTLPAQEDLKISLSKAGKTKINTAVSTLSTQILVYTGSAQHYSAFETLPYGLSDVILKYNTGTEEYEAIPPVNVGEYGVQITRLVDKYISFVTKTTKLIIEAAPIKITSLPIVSNNNGNYSISGGTAHFNNTAVACELEIIERSSDNTFAKVEFSPLSVNYQKTYCWVPIGNQFASYTLKFNTINGAIPLLLNGGKEIANGEKVAAGTTIQLSVPIVPAGYTVKKVINRINDTQSEDIILDNGVKDILIQKDYNLFVELEANTTDKLPQWTSIIKNASSYGYTGTARVHSSVSITGFFFPSGTANRPDYKTNQKIRYKDSHGNFVVPINAGDYELSVFYPAQNGKDSISVATTFTITKATPLLPELPQTVSSVPYGFRLNQVPIYDGQANVPGTFQWLDGDQMVQPGTTYTIQFIPEDSQNYNTITAHATTLSVNNDQLILFGSTNGTITVKNKLTGTGLASGDLIHRGDELVISATPYNGYYLHRLSVCKNYGMEQTISSGAVYTVDDDNPLVINAEFRSNNNSSVSNPVANAPVQSNATYRVYVPTVAGVVASPTGYNSVKEGDTFTLRMDYDTNYSTPTVKANNQTIQPKSGNEYTYSNVNSDVVFSIDVPQTGLYKVLLPTPTAYGQVTLEELNNLRSGNDGFVYGSKIKLTAIPAEGNYFTRWWDGSTENPREYTIQGDLSVKAEFSGSPSGIFAPTETAYRVYIINKQIKIEVDQPSAVTITDIQGRTVYHTQIEGSANFPINNSGVYIVTLYGDDKLIRQQKVRVE